MKRQLAKDRHHQGGFSLIEVIIALIVLGVGMLAIAQSVPLMMGLNSGNRYGSEATVIAQRELDGLIAQPLGSTTFADPQGILCPLGNICNLGNAALPLQVVGSRVIMFSRGPLIDFTVAQVAGYSFNYNDPDDPNSPTYDVRWAVISYSNGGVASGKRFIVGVRKVGGNAALSTATLDGMVEK